MNIWDMLFGRYEAPKYDMPPSATSQDDAAALEKAITEVGRERVFAVARAAGWHSGDTPPMWVWWAIINDLKAGRAIL